MSSVRRRRRKAQNRLVKHFAGWLNGSPMAKFLMRPAPGSPEGREALIPLRYEPICPMCKRPIP